MNSGIANYIVGLIDTQTYIDKIAGLVTPITTKQKDITKIVPFACGVQHRDCVSGKYDDLVPNSRYKSVIYFEDQGVNFGLVKGDRQYFTSKLRMVVWLNMQKLGEAGCVLSNQVLLSIFATIPQFPVNFGNYLQMKITPVSEPIKNKNIFSPYSYDEAVNQYLIAPYDYFAIDFNVSWWMVLECLDTYVPDPAIACPTQPS